MSTLLYIDKIPASQQAAFTAKVKTIAAKLLVDPNWLMQVMKAESGVNPQAVNATGCATGLIQFMPKTATNLGTTTAALYKMNAVEQLDWVYKYFSPWTGKLKSYYDVYAVTFFPLIVGKPDTWVVESKDLSAALIARQNKIIDINKNGQITVGEFKQYVKNTVVKSNWEIVFGAFNAAKDAVASNAGTLGAAVAIAFFFTH